MKTTSAALLLLLLLLAGEMTTMHALVTEHHRVNVEGPAGRVNAKGKRSDFLESSRFRKFPRPFFFNFFACTIYPGRCLPFTAPTIGR